MQKLLRKLLILSAVLFVIVLFAYGTLYFTDFGKDDGTKDNEAVDERRELNIDRGLVSAYSPGFAGDGSETIISLHSDGNAIVNLQGSGVSGATFGFWERVGSQVRFEFISTNGSGVPSGDFALDIRGENLVGLGEQEFKRLTEGNLTADADFTKESAQGLAVRGAFNYTETVLGGTEVEFVNMVPTSNTCTDCFTVSLRYLKANTPTAVDLRVVGGVVVR